MKSDDNKPFQTWPKAINMNNGITGFVRISNTSNCTAAAAACRAFTGSLWYRLTHAQMPSGMIASLKAASAAFSATAPDAFASLAFVNNSWLRLSLSSSVSFFLRLWSVLLLGPSCATAMFAVLGAGAAADASAPSGLRVESSAAGCAAGAGSACGSLGPDTAALQKATKRMAGRNKQFSSVGNGPMTTVVTKAIDPQITPMRQRYTRNCFRIL
mmetsp:Transcript_103076/g.298126  ORF Transcript_103076/g.298126 Transcript_103076/m.298126 type:complete len:214 (+) Transcript_103076:920-1561(+)